MALFGTLVPDRKAAPWRLSLFGHVRLEGPNSAGRTLGASNLGRLLALLADPAGRDVLKTDVIAQLWPERDPNDARNSLRVCVHEVRRMFRSFGHEGDVLSSDHNVLRLHEGLFETDLEAFESGLRAARHSMSPSAKVINIEAALREVQGEYLAGVDDPWAEVRRKGVEDQVVLATVELIELLASIGKPDEALTIGRSMLRAFRSREELHRAVMRTYGYKGDPGQAFRQYDVLARILDDEFGLEPSKATDETLNNLPGPVSRFVAPDERPSLETAGDRSHAALVARFAASKFIGREAPMADLCRWLHPLAGPTSRLVSVTGISGTGKSRLCAEAAESLRHAYGGRVWIVDMPHGGPVEGHWALLKESLTPQTSPGSSAETAVRAELALGPALLVLDCDGAPPLSLDPFVERLLAEFPDLRLLCAFQVRLGLEAERVVHLKPMAVPKPGASVAEIQDSESVRLFMERATRIDPAFRADVLAIEAIAGICRSLAGLPLAILLAAGLVNSYGVEGLCSSLSDQKLLKKARPSSASAKHLDLESAFQWSLSQVEPHLADTVLRLSVFADNFDLSAARAVLGRDRIHADIADLIDAGWIEGRLSGESARFELLEPVQVFLAAKLRKTAQADEVKDLHRTHYVRLAQHVFQEWAQCDKSSVSELVAADLPNFIAAVQSGLSESRDVDASCRIVGGLEPVFNFRAHPGKWYSVAKSVAQATGSTVSFEAASAHSALATLAYFEFEFDVMFQAAARQVKILESLDPPADRMAAAMTKLALAHRCKSQTGQAVAMYRRSIAFAVRHQARASLHQTRYNLACVLEADGREGALRQYQKAAKEAASKGDARFLGLATNSMARLARQGGDFESAREACLRALDILDRTNDVRARAYVEMELANTLLATGDWTGAVGQGSASLKSAVSFGELNLARSVLAVLAAAYSELGDKPRAGLAAAVFESLHARIPTEPYAEDVERVRAARQSGKCPRLKATTSEADLADVVQSLVLHD